MRERYWHIQMFLPNGKGGGEIDSIKMLQESSPVIGTGEWDDIQCSYFKGERNGLKVGDIVLVREGKKLLALCEIISDYFTSAQLEKKYINKLYRHVRVLDWNSEKRESSLFTQGTLKILYKSSDTVSYNYINDWYKKNLAAEKMENIKKLLTYKKQIILQGPPGTGKTREAKLVAESILGLDQKFDIDIFRNAVNSIKKFPATNNNNAIVIDSFNNDTIHFKETPSVEKYSFIIKELYDCYISEDYQKENFVQYPQYSKRCLVRHIIKDYKKSLLQEQYKLIQFHPSYTYEDFVRGIVAKPSENGDNLVFTAENKVLGEFIEKALNNLDDCKKGITELSLEKWLNEQFEKFIYYISEKLEKGESIELTESVFIIELDNDALRYKGLKGWNKKGNRMLFKDIKQAYIDENLGRQDIKHNQNLSGLAKWHASYYIRVLDMFKAYLEENKIIFQLNNFEVEKLKNYILIIDEINRANLSSVLGELIYAMEYRGEAVESMYAIDIERKNKLILPPNLYIIGTMNTADRSVGHIDYAIRRRFAFVDVPAVNLKKTQGLQTFDDVLFDTVAALFDTNLSPEFEKKEVQLGHSYFIDKANDKDGASMDIRLEYEIKPILREYVRDGVLIGENIKQKIEDLNPSI